MLISVLLVGLSGACQQTQVPSRPTSTGLAKTWSIAEPWAGSDEYVPSLFPVSQDGKWGYIDRTGEVVVDFQYVDAWPFWNGLAPVQVGVLWGYIDESGAMAIRPQFEEARLFHDGLAKVKTQAGWGYIDKDGVIVFLQDPAWVGSYDFSEGLAPVWLDKETDRYGYIDTSGKLVIELGEVTGADNFSEGLAAARKNGVYGYIDRSGQFVIQPQFYRASGFSGGPATVERAWGEFEIIDRTGRVLRNLDYGYVGGFSDARAQVTVGDWLKALEEGVHPLDFEAWCGYIDETGELVIPAVFENVADFWGGLAAVTDQNGKNAYIDLDGNYVWREQ